MNARLNTRGKSAPAAVASDTEISEHALRAEQELLGVVMSGGHAAYDAICDRIAPEHFALEAHQHVFSRMRACVAEGLGVDPVTLAEGLRGIEVQEGKKILPYLTSLFHSAHSPASVSAFADIVERAATERRMRAVLTNGLNLLSTSEPTDQKVRQISDSVLDVVTPQARASTRTAGEVLVETLTGLHSRSQNRGEISGIRTGFDGLDEATLGFQPGELIIIAGRPSMGKTSIALQIATHVSVEAGLSSLVFSLEMSAEQLQLRQISLLSGIPLMRFRSGELEPGDFEAVKIAAAKLGDSPMTYNEASSLTVGSMRAIARREHAKNPLGLIMVDYMQLMGGANIQGKRAEQVSEISRGLKVMARDFGVPVVALSQLNRSLEQRPDKRPIMSDLRESGSIEQDADLILFLYRDEYYNPESADRGVAEVIIGKQRNGPRATIRLGFEGACTRFHNNAPSAIESYTARVGAPPVRRWDNEEF